MTAQGEEVLATVIPHDVVSNLCEESLVRVPEGWTEFTDRDSDVWWLTNASHDGDAVMLPGAGDMPTMLRRDVERLHGPLLPRKNRTEGDR